MPDNVLRTASKRTAPETGTDSKTARPSRPSRCVTITAGVVSVRAELLETPTAARLWVALPLFSAAGRWGAALHFELPVESGREAGARFLVEAGEICYWSEEDRVIVGFGPTPLSGRDEIRMPVPCNVWACALDDVRAFARVRPGERVSLVAASPARGGRTIPG